jgi:uncharacterized protein
MQGIRTEDFRFEAGRQMLAATRFFAAAGDPPSIVSFHGFGKTASRARIRYLLMLLAQCGLSSISFDFSGNGESTGALERCSLDGRTIEAGCAANLLGEPRAIIGTSMGAHLAAVVSAAIRPRNLILFCPAAYVDRVAALRFDGSFERAEDRMPTAENNDSSPALRALRSFEGNLLIFAASDDKLIPPQIPHLLLNAAIKARSKRIIVIDGCEHLVHPWLECHEAERRTVLAAILSAVDGEAGRQLPSSA